MICGSGTATICSTISAQAGSLPISPRSVVQVHHDLSRDAADPAPVECKTLPHFVPASEALRQSSGTWRDVRKYQQNHKNAGHCLNRRRARPLLLRPCSRERSDESRPQDPESTQSRRNCLKFVHKASSN